MKYDHFSKEELLESERSGHLLKHLHVLLKEAVACDTLQAHHAFRRAHWRQDAALVLDVVLVVAPQHVDRIWHCYIELHGGPENAVIAKFTSINVVPQEHQTGVRVTFGIV